eukprot:358519-Chlamydomonas_euryale.AAC.8
MTADNRTRTRARIGLSAFGRVRRVATSARHERSCGGGGVGKGGGLAGRLGASTSTSGLYPGAADASAKRSVSGWLLDQVASGATGCSRVVGVASVRPRADDESGKGGHRGGRPAGSVAHTSPAPAVAAAPPHRRHPLGPRR